MNNTSEPFEMSADYFDSRDVIARIDYLVAEWEGATDDTFADYALSADDFAVGLSRDEAEELAALLAFQSEAESVADWQYGETFVSDDYFEDYARELATDIGAIDPAAGWPTAHIDWEAAANALQSDYTDFELGGTTYWARREHVRTNRRIPRRQHATRDYRNGRRNSTLQCGRGAGTVRNARAG